MLRLPLTTSAISSITWKTQPTGFLFSFASIWTYCFISESLFLYFPTSFFAAQIAYPQNQRVTIDEFNAIVEEGSLAKHRPMVKSSAHVKGKVSAEASTTSTLNAEKGNSVMEASADTTKALATTHVDSEPSSNIVLSAEAEAIATSNSPPPSPP